MPIVLILHLVSTTGYRYYIGSSQVVTVDSSGNFLVGKTSLGFSSDGFEARANGQVYITDTSDVPLVVRRNSTGDDIVNFFKDDTKVGKILSRASLVTTIILDPRTDGIGLLGTGNAFYPPINQEIVLMVQGRWYIWKPF